MASRLLVQAGVRQCETQVSPGSGNGGRASPGNWSPIDLVDVPSPSCLSRTASEGSTSHEFQGRARERTSKPNEKRGSYRVYASAAPLLLIG